MWKDWDCFNLRKAIAIYSHMDIVSYQINYLLGSVTCTLVVSVANVWWWVKMHAKYPTHTSALVSWSLIVLHHQELKWLFISSISLSYQLIVQHASNYNQLYVHTCAYIPWTLVRANNFLLALRPLHLFRAKKSNIWGNCKQKKSIEWNSYSWKIH